MHIDVDFEIEDTAIQVSQTIEILNQDSPEVFLARLNSGQYLTSLDYELRLTEVKTGQVLALPTLEPVGQVIFQEIHHDMSYINFKRAG